MTETIFLENSSSTYPLPPPMLDLMELVADNRSNCIFRLVFSVLKVSMVVCFSMRFSAKAWSLASKSEVEADDVDWGIVEVRIRREKWVGR